MPSHTHIQTTNTSDGKLAANKKLINGGGEGFATLDGLRASLQRRGPPVTTLQQPLATSSNVPTTATMLAHYYCHRARANTVLGQ